MCRCLDNFCLVDGGWTYLHDPSFSLVFLGFGLSFSPSSFFLACLVGMWHTFFGHASFLFFLFFYMPCGHVAYLLCVCIFYFFFFIARILDGNLEKESHVMAWSFIECMDGCACYLPVWKYSVENLLSHYGSQQFDKAQWENKLHMWKDFSNL